MTETRLLWTVNQLLWYADDSKVANPFTAKFWYRLDILSQLTPVNNGGDQKDTLLRGAYLFRRSLVLTFGIMVSSTNISDSCAVERS